LDEIWVGENSYQCDGRLSDFSILTYLLGAPVSVLPGKKVGFQELIINKFTPNVDEGKFWYQYKFRVSSIAYIF